MRATGSKFTLYNCCVEFSTRDDDARHLGVHLRHDFTCTVVVVLADVNDVGFYLGYNDYSWLFYAAPYSCWSS